jgi:hypothetical protein
MSWHELAAGLTALSVDRCFRLWLLLHWQARVEKSKDGWLLPKMHMLEKLELRGKRYHEIVDRLERLGLVEVERRGRKRALLRLRRLRP